MKFQSDAKYKVEEQIGAEALPDEHPSASELKEIFGDHTFFLDQEGLTIVVPEPASDNASGNVVKIASWTESREELQLHEPQVQPTVIDIESGRADDDSAA